MKIIVLLHSNLLHFVLCLCLTFALSNSAGKMMSQVIRGLKEIWVESDFTMTEETLLSRIPDLLDEIQSHAKLSGK